MNKQQLEMINKVLVEIGKLETFDYVIDNISLQYAPNQINLRLLKKKTGEVVKVEEQTEKEEVNKLLGELV